MPIQHKALLAGLLSHSRELPAVITVRSSAAPAEQVAVLLPFLSSQQRKSVLLLLFLFSQIAQGFELATFQLLTLLAIIALFIMEDRPRLQQLERPLL